MAKNYSVENLPKSFSEAVKAVIKNVAFSAILGVIIYISVLFIYRTIGSPNFCGYVKTTFTQTENGKETESSEKYYFKPTEKHTVPKSDDTHSYIPVYAKDAFPEVLSQILMFIIYCIMLYNIAWGFGAHSYSAIVGNREKRDKIKGVKLGLASSFMFLISYIFMLISKFIFKINFATKLFGIVNGAFLPLYNACLGGVPQGFVGISGVLEASSDNFYTYGFAVMLIPFVLKIAICYIGYELGFKQISIKDKAIFKTNN